MVAKRTSVGGPRANRRLSAACRAVVVVSAIIGLTVVHPVVPGSAQELDDRKDRVQRQIEQTEKRVDQSSARLSTATKRLTKAVAALDAARTTLAQTRGELAAANALDRKIRAKLAESIEELASGRAALSQARANVSERQETLRRIAVQQYASGGSELMSLSTVFLSQDPAQLTSQLNSHKNVLAKEAAALDRLEASQVMLAVQASRSRSAKQKVAEQRRAAAENVARKAELEATAERTRVRIQELVAVRRQAQASAAGDKVEALRRLREFRQERDEISALLERRAERARLRAEAAARARADAAERRHAKRMAQREAQAAAEKPTRNGPSTGAGRQHESKVESGARSHPAAPQQGPPASPGNLMTPVSGYVTSPFGMRLHPVYKRWSLHDGTDFGASCGTPIRAAAGGTVVGAYYDSAYGNRVIIDHGLLNGKGLGTSYNHMSGFSAFVGQKVTRGDVIGYVGTTGYSTGCHLHFMVFENGNAVDPMGWL